MPKINKYLRDVACDLLLNTFGNFSPADIRPLHMQALYDKMAIRPATVNRRMDDLSKIFAWDRTRGFCDINPCKQIERQKGGGGYEPWPDWALEKLFAEGRPHVVQAAVELT